MAIFQRRWNQAKPVLQNCQVMTVYDRDCHAFSLDRSFKFAYPGNGVRGLVKYMDHYRTRFFNGQRAQERADDGGGDLPLSQDHPTYAVSLLTESPDSCLQAWERMA